MMGLLSGIPILGKIVDGAFDVVDQMVEDKDLANQIKSELKKQAQSHSADFEKEVTKRWIADKDGVLTKNIRPLSFMFVLIIFGIVIFTDGNIQIGEWIFKVKAAYIPVIESLLNIMVLAYFGSRGLEKSVSIYKKDKRNE